MDLDMVSRRSNARLTTDIHEHASAEKKTPVLKDRKEMRNNGAKNVMGRERMRINEQTATGMNHTWSGPPNLLSIGSIPDDQPLFHGRVYP